MINMKNKELMEKLDEILNGVVDGNITDYEYDAWEEDEGGEVTIVFSKNGVDLYNGPEGIYVDLDINYDDDKYSLVHHPSCHRLDFECIDELLDYFEGVVESIVEDVSDFDEVAYSKKYG